MELKAYNESCICRIKKQMTLEIMKDDPQERSPFLSQGPVTLLLSFSSYSDSHFFSICFSLLKCNGSFPGMLAEKRNKKKSLKIIERML
jgi:hypothetical protein